MNKNKINKNNSWYTPINNLMLWRGSWTKYEWTASNLTLRIIYDQILITADTKILESFNMHHKIKGIYKDDVLILIVNGSNNDIRKIKLQLLTNIPQSLEMLGSHFPLVSHKHSSIQSLQVNPKYRNIEEVLKYALDRKEVTGGSNLPKEFEKFVKLCLLDPSFPQMVAETEAIISKDFPKK